MIAKELVTGSIPSLTLADSVQYALHCMDECKVSHLPVIQDDIFIGLIQEKECLLQTDSGIPVRETGIPLTLISVKEDEHLFSVIEMITNHRVTVLPVIGFENNYIRSILPGDLLNILSGLLSVNQPGGIIRLEMQEHDYLPSEIARIVESNDATILVLTAMKSPKSSTLEVTLKINRPEIGPLLQTLNRYNYIVKGHWSKEDSYTANLQERFDALMNYLNI